MCKRPFWIALLLVWSLALPAVAQDEGETDWDDPEAWDEWDEDEGGGFADYADSVGNRYLISINSILTWPADLVMSTAQPRDEFDELPAAAVSKYPVGLLQGSLLAAYRLGTGVFDLLFAPLTPMKVMSPEPRYLIFKSAEHPWY